MPCYCTKLPKHSGRIRNLASSLVTLGIIYPLAIVNWRTAEILVELQGDIRDLEKRLERLESLDGERYGY